jgi:hypothetical protein
MKDYGMLNHFVPLLAPISKSNSDWATGWIDLKEALDCTFLVHYGVLTASSTVPVMTVTIQAASTAATAGATAIAFNYRISAATGTDTWGDVTAATAVGGVTITSVYDGMMLLASVDPAVVLAGTTAKKGRYVRMLSTKSTTFTTALVEVMAVIKPAHAGATMVASE